MTASCVTSGPAPFLQPTPAKDAAAVSNGASFLNLLPFCRFPVPFLIFSFFSQ
jgi:hypothetical protein